MENTLRDELYEISERSLRAGAPRIKAIVVKEGEREKSIFKCLKKICIADAETGIKTASIMLPQKTDEGFIILQEDIKKFAEINNLNYLTITGGAILGFDKKSEK